MSLKPALWRATKADGLVAILTNIQTGGGASFSKFTMRKFRLGNAQTPNGTPRITSCIGIAAFDAHVNLLNVLITPSAAGQFVAGGDIRWCADTLDSAPAIHGTPNFHFILKEDGTRLKEFVITYNAGGLYGGDNIVMAWTQAKSTSQFAQTT